MFEERERLLRAAWSIGDSGYVITIVWFAALRKTPMMSQRSAASVEDQSAEVLQAQAVGSQSAPGSGCVTTSGAPISSTHPGCWGALRMVACAATWLFALGDFEPTLRRTASC